MASMTAAHLMGESAEVVEFFYQHAGYSYNPTAESPEEGRRRCARALARAERLAREAGFDFQWGDDWGCDHVAEFDYPAEPETCECVSMVDEGGEDHAWMGCVDDADDTYRRVVEAALALDNLDIIEQALAGR